VAWDADWLAFTDYAGFGELAGLVAGVAVVGSYIDRFITCGSDATVLHRRRSKYMRTLLLLLWLLNGYITDSLLPSLINHNRPGPPQLTALPLRNRNRVLAGPLRPWHPLIQNLNLPRLPHLRRVILKFRTTGPWRNTFKGVSEIGWGC
jgi:hypothetical protein